MQGLPIGTAGQGGDTVVERWGLRGSPIGTVRLSIDIAEEIWEATEWYDLSGKELTVPHFQVDLLPRYMH